MKNYLLLIGAMLGVFFASCTSHPRVVENPLIETASMVTLYIVKVELSDTATVLHVNAYFRPRWWIRIDTKTYLQADGKQYMMTAAEGIQPDSLFWMPDSGEASFVLTFEPLPLRTKSFDFIESDCNDCFKLYGIDLTGKKEYAEYPEGLPKELRKAPKDGPVPDPILTVGETTVNVHLLGYRKGTFQNVVLYVNSLLTEQNNYEAKVDPDTGIATAKFEQYGTGAAFLANVGIAFSQFWIAPGETMDLYVDLRSAGQFIVQRRNKDQQTQLRPRLYTTGTYADLNALCNQNECGIIGLDTHMGEFADYRMTADEYTQMVLSKYKSLADSISRSNMSGMFKELSLLSLQQETLNAIASGSFFLEHNYRSVNNLWDRRDKIDYKFATIGPEHVAAVCELFDAGNPKLPMGFHIYEYREAARNPQIDWAEVAHVTEGPMVDLRKVGFLPFKAENNELTEEDIDMLHALKEPFYAEVCEAIQKRVRKELEALEGKVTIEPTPEVSLDKLFDAIVAPYKGKVVFVDFWNTWCGPCKASIKANEPLKSAELKSDDLVWIYIANETSPLATYKTNIAKIQGKHYRLNDKQWRYLCDKFKVDGIPSYVLVDRDGTSKLRNDLRDHDKLKTTLKKMIE